MLWDIGTWDVLDRKTAEEQLERRFQIPASRRETDGRIRADPAEEYRQADEWLLIKKKDAVATPGWTDEGLG